MQGVEQVLLFVAKRWFSGVNCASNALPASRRKFQISSIRLTKKRKAIDRQKAGSTLSRINSIE